MIKPTPNLILGIDFETTGLEVSKDDIDVIIEVGAVLWDWKAGKPLALYSDTVQLAHGRILDDEIVALTGITQNMVEAPIAKPEAEVMDNLLRLMNIADCYMAHNAAFDKACAHAAFERNFMEYPDKLWLDTVADVPYPAGLVGRRLPHLAADHQFLNPFAHRAVFDVLTMFKIATKYPIETIVKYADSPIVRLVGRFPIKDNERGKRCGFRWDPDGKGWYLDIKQAKLDAVRQLIDVPYDVEVKY